MTALYPLLYLLRRFDETVLDKFPTGVFFGTTHTYTGQEANAVGVLTNLQPGDIVFSNHRCHGHFLAYGGDPRALFAELMGRATGVCGGRGGSQHLHWRNFYSNGVQGGILPVATGMALAEKRKGSGAVVVCFLGDGTLGEGAVYEALNLAALWGAPILYVLENNRIAQTTPIELAVAGNIAARFAAFGIPVDELDSSDVIEIMRIAENSIGDVRARQAPRALILHTARFGPHSKGDDTREPEAVARLRETRDPLEIHASRLPAAERAAIEQAVEATIRAAFEQALTDPFPATADRRPAFAETTAVRRPPTTPHHPLPTTHFPPPTSHHSLPTILASLNAALHRAFADDERVLLLGEDVLDPYGGAFKVSRGLSSAFPGRVLTTPISEAGITGVAAGMALRGYRPVVEIMFGDFLSLAADQIINHAAKFRWMYNEQVRVPLVIRTPMGGRRGYGPTHSQSLEKHFLGVPGLCVLAPAPFGDPGELLYRAILETEDPVLFVENKLLYLLPIANEASLSEFTLTLLPSSPGRGAGGEGYALTLQSAPPPTLTLAAYGYMAELARQAMLRLAYEHEIFAELIVPTQLAPVDVSAILESARRTGRLLTIEEGGYTLGWGAEIVAQTAGALGSPLKAASRLGAGDYPIPASAPLEAAVLPSVEEIVQMARRMV